MQASGLARGLGATVRPWRAGKPADRNTATTMDGGPRRAAGARDDRRPARSVSATPTTRPARGSTPTLDAVCRIASDGRRMGDRRRDLSRRGARRRRHADGVGTIRARGRDERLVEGLRPARAAHRLARRAARARRRPLVRSTTTPRSPRAGSTIGWRGSRWSRRGGRRCSRGRAGSSAPTIRSSGAGSSGRTASATSRRKRAPSRFVRHTHPYPSSSSPRGFATSAACCWCRATTSTWTGSSGSDSDPIRSISSRRWP